MPNLPSIIDGEGAIERCALAADFTRGNIVEDKVNAACCPLVHDAVFFLIVDFIHFPDRHLLRSPIDHKTDARVSDDGDMNTVAVVK